MSRCHGSPDPQREYRPVYFRIFNNENYKELTKLTKKKIKTCFMLLRTIFLVLSSDHVFQVTLYNLINFNGVYFNF